MRKEKSIVDLAQKGALAEFKSLLNSRKHTPVELYHAVRTAFVWDQKEKALMLLEAGADPLQVNEENSQLLTHAAIGGNPDLVEKLISLGCDPNHTNVNGRRPLHDAACSGTTDAVETLIKAGADPNCRDTWDRTPLSEAVAHKRHETAMALILAGAESTAELLKQIPTPLMMAVSGGSAKNVHRLLAQGCQTEEKNADGITPLMMAAKSGKMDIVKLLLEAGANVNATDKNGRKAFMWALGASQESALLLIERTPMSPRKAMEALIQAVGRGYITVIDMLLGKKAMIQPEEDGGESALIKAVEVNSLEAFDRLFHHPLAKIDFRSGRFLRTALMTACRNGNAAMCRMLLEAGADPGIVDLDRRGAAHHAAGSSQAEILALLKSSGADLSAVDRSGNSLLHLAVHDPEVSRTSKAVQETVKWLLEQQLPANKANTNGITPLMHAAVGGLTEITRLLIEHGADVNRVDSNGYSALYHAMYCGADYGINDRYRPPKSIKTDPAADVISLLLKSGADPGLPGLLNAARAYRWPGAAKLLIQYGAAPS